MNFNEFTFTIFASIIAGAYASIVLIIIMAGTSVQTWLIQAIVNIYEEIEIENRLLRSSDTASFTCKGNLNILNENRKHREQ